MRKLRNLLANNTGIFFMLIMVIGRPPGNMPGDSVPNKENTNHYADMDMAARIQFHDRLWEDRRDNDPFPSLSDTIELHGRLRDQQ